MSSTLIIRKPSYKMRLNRDEFRAMYSAISYVIEVLTEKKAEEKHQELQKLYLTVMWEIKERLSSKLACEQSPSTCKLKHFEGLVFLMVFRNENFGRLFTGDIYTANILLMQCNSMLQFYSITK